MKQAFIQNSHPITLFLAASKVLEKYENWKYWDAEVIAKEINDFIRPNKLSRENFNKIMAMKTLYTTDAPWENWDLFLYIFQALNGLTVDRETIYLTDHPLPYLYNAVEIINLARKQDFGDQVKRFCAAIFLHENVHYCPEPLDFAQLFVSNPLYTCKNCGKEGSALPPFNFVCEDCGGVYDGEKKDKLFNFKPAEITPETMNVEIYLEFPTTDIKKRYDELKEKLLNSEEVHIEENEVDIQVGKLLQAAEYTGHEFLRLSEEVSKYGLS